jgi:hypothetical protein
MRLEDRKYFSIFFPRHLLASMLVSISLLIPKRFGCASGSRIDWNGATQVIVMTL